MSVAVIGGGISGLCCASRLVELGLRAVVFDTGAREVGGRCSSRRLSVGGVSYVADHSAQYFTVTDRRFAARVQRWLASGACKPWAARIASLDARKGGAAVAAGAAAAAAAAESSPGHPLIGGAGMQSISRFLAAGVEVRRPVWVSKIRRQGAQWQLSGGDGQALGSFDYAVIAHNGKCADRLAASASIPRLHTLLRAKFGAKLRSPSQPIMQLNSLWVLVVVLPPGRGAGAPFDAATVANSPELRWCANNNTKSRPTSATSGGAPRPEDVGECWTLISTPEFGAAHKVPQESVPDAKAKEVTALLLAAFARAIGAPPAPAPGGLAPPAFTKLQLWGAAVPLNGLKSAPGHEFAFDAAAAAGICGDWLCPNTLGIGIEAAAVSGDALAEHIVRCYAAEAGARSGARLDVNVGPRVGGAGGGAGGGGGGGRAGGGKQPAFTQPRGHTSIGCIRPGERVDVAAAAATASSSAATTTAAAAAVGRGGGGGEARASAGAGAAADGRGGDAPEERRLDGGEAFTRAEFASFYGGTAEWEAAPRIAVPRAQSAAVAAAAVRASAAAAAPAAAAPPRPAPSVPAAARSGGRRARKKPAGGIVQR